jgi:EAL domain-containing protein (putative c-di-GMP-specific phosphodiesterase class I)
MREDHPEDAMTSEQQVLEKLRDLPAEKQKEALDFLDQLKERDGPKEPLKSLLGLWKDLNIQITEENIAKAPARCGATFRVT